MTFSDKMKRLFRLMRDGQLIISGGGCTVRQLPSGEYQISLQTSDLKQNNNRAPGGTGDADSSQGSTPGKPQKPNNYPPLTLPPLPPPSPPDSSGSYDGPSNSGNKTKSSDSNKSDPYDFNQRGWPYYIDNF